MSSVRAGQGAPGGRSPRCLRLCVGHLLLLSLLDQLDETPDGSVGDSIEDLSLGPSVGDGEAIDVEGFEPFESSVAFSSFFVSEFGSEGFVPNRFASARRRAAFPSN